MISTIHLPGVHEKSFSDLSQIKKIKRSKMVTYDHYSEYLKINFGNSTELHRRITRTLTLDKV